jgi:hypothetical protein
VGVAVLFRLLKTDSMRRILFAIIALLLLAGPSRAADQTMCAPILGLQNNFDRQIYLPSGAAAILDGRGCAFIALDRDIAWLRTQGYSVQTGTLGYLPLNPANNLSDVSSIVASRTNLGLGSAALESSSALLQVTSNLSDLGSATAARTNLGLGSAALESSSAILQVTNSLSDVGSASAARTNLGLGSAAILSSSALLQVANNLSDVSSAPAARTNLGIVQISLKDFGAACDGATDDTTAIQNWLNASIAGNVILTAPSGICKFSAPLGVNYAPNYSIHGTGVTSTIFEYTGTDYNGSVTGNGTWVATATTINTTGAVPSQIATALANGYYVTAWDMAGGVTRLIGRVTGSGASTLTVAAPGAVYASLGAADTIHLTTDLIRLNDYSHGSEIGTDLEGFDVVSNTVLTGGFALHMILQNDLFIKGVYLDDRNSKLSNNGNLCGGLWLDGISNGYLLDLNTTSFKNCAEGLLVNSPSAAASAELQVVGGNIGGKNTAGVTSGFTAGMHEAGGFGGLRCDNTNIHGNLIGILVDQQDVNLGNREFNLGSTCAVDSNQNAGILLNDTAAGGWFDLAGWVASTQQGPGVNIDNFANQRVVLRNENIFNNCGSGIYDQDSTTQLFIETPGITNNGFGTLSAACATWLAGAGAGQGYGVQSTFVNHMIEPLAQPYGNNLAPFDANTQQATHVIKFGVLADVTAATPVCSINGCTATGTGYGTTITGGSMTLISGAGGFVCATPPVLTVNTNGSGNITTVSAIATAGSCTAIGAMQNATWTPGGGLSVGSGAVFNLTWTPLNQTYTPSVGVSTDEIYVYGGGGQGGGGASVVSGTASSGGGGGGGGKQTMCKMKRSDLPAGSVTNVAIGLGGRNGGTPSAVASGAGATGQAGGLSMFGTLCEAVGGGGGFGGINAATIAGGGAGAGWAIVGANGASGAGGAAAQGGGAGGGAAGGGIPTMAGPGAGGGGTSAAGAAGAGGNGLAGGAGGGSGGGLTSGPANNAGGNGGAIYSNGTTNGTAPTGGAANTSGGNSGTSTVPGPNMDACTGAAGGGSGLTTTVAGNGGAGCVSAGGGGAGSVVDGVGSSPGYGGPGGDGEVLVIERFN